MENFHGINADLWAMLYYEKVKTLTETVEDWLLRVASVKALLKCKTVKRVPRPVPREKLSTFNTLFSPNRRVAMR